MTNVATETAPGVMLPSGKNTQPVGRGISIKHVEFPSTVCISSSKKYHINTTCGDEDEQRKAELETQEQGDSNITGGK